MKAYSVGITKDQFIKEIRRHQKEDNFIKGVYIGEEDKGCAVRCSVGSIHKITGRPVSIEWHKNYEIFLGIPEWLAEIEEYIFEGLDYSRDKKWPLQFSEAINVGSDLNEIKGPFVDYILKQAIKLQKQILKNAPKRLHKTMFKNIESLKEMIKVGEIPSIMEIITPFGLSGNAVGGLGGAVRFIAEMGGYTTESIESKLYEKYANKLLKLIKECK